MIPAWLTPTLMRWIGIGAIIAVLIGAFATLKIQRDSARNEATRELLRAEQIETAYLTLSESVKKQNSALDALGKETEAAQEQARKAKARATETGIKADARILGLTNFKRQGDDCEDAKRLLLDYQEGRL